MVAAGTTILEEELRLGYHAYAAPQKVGIIYRCFAGVADMDVQFPCNFHRQSSQVLAIMAGSDALRIRRLAARRQVMAEMTADKSK